MTQAPHSESIPKPKLAFVDLDKLHWTGRAREDLGDIESLTESIKDKGVIQPITCTPEFKLLAGERRVTAAIAAGLLQIPALIRKEADVIDGAEIELIENALRKDFNWSEQAKLIRRIDLLCKDKRIEWSSRKTAQLMNMGVASVSRSLQLAKAIEVFPELETLGTADEAFKTLKKMEEQTITEELVRRQEHSINTGGLDRGIAEMLKIANANYTVGDTFKELAALRTNGVVHIIECDPPYGINLTELKASKDNVTSNVHTYNEIAEDAYPKFLERLTKELYRVAGPDCWLVFWFGPTWQHQVLISLRAAGWLVDEIPAIWAKTQGQTMQPELYFARGYEPFYLARKGKPVMVNRGRLNVFNYSGATDKYHPTERPVALIEDILETLGVSRQIVLVPFLGSGATLRAAYNLGMSAFGFDISAEYKPKFMLAIEEDARTLNGESDDTGESK